MAKINVVLYHVCTHMGLARPGEPPEDGEMNEITLHSRGRIMSFYFNLPVNKPNVMYI